MPRGGWVERMVDEVRTVSRSDMSGEGDGQSSKRKPPTAVPLIFVSLKKFQTAVIISICAR